MRFLKKISKEICRSDISSEKPSKLIVYRYFVLMQIERRFG
jgi:hypothetical protein